jgi:transposase
MNQHALNNSEVRAEQAASKRYQSIKLGLDLHAETIVAVRIIENGAPQPAQKFVPARFVEWVKTQQRLAQEVHSCYEAGSLGYWLHRELRTMGVKNLVVQPVCLDEQHKGVNTDRSDARQLAQRLDRYVAGNDQALATVRVPTPPQEQKRVQSRQREQLRREVHRVGAQGRSLLLNQGRREKGRWWAGRRWERLEPTLPEWLVERLGVYRRVLEVLNRELALATTQLTMAAPQELPKGLGGLSHEVIEREVADWQRFKNRRQVASYTGLCGGVSASGPQRHQLSITKHGNVRLRAALIELAWRLVMWQPQCKLVRKWWRVLGKAKATSAARKKAIVAVARQMAVDLWRWRTSRVQPEQLGWIMTQS